MIEPEETRPRVLAALGLDGAGERDRGRDTGRAEPPLDARAEASQGSTRRPLPAAIASWVERRSAGGDISRDRLTTLRRE